MSKIFKPLKKTTIALIASINEAVKVGSYYFTNHALLRSRQRGVNKFQVLRILGSHLKFHESRKDSFNDESKAWNYAIRGTTIDGDDIRVIVSFDESNMLVITVINLDE